MIKLAGAALVLALAVGFGFAGSNTEILASTSASGSATICCECECDASDCGDCCDDSCGDSESFTCTLRCVETPDGVECELVCEGDQGCVATCAPECCVDCGPCDTPCGDTQQSGQCVPSSSCQPSACSSK